MVRAYELAVTLDDVHFAGFGHACQAAGEFGNDFFFVAAQFVHVDFGFAEFDAVFHQVFHFVNHGRVVQQRFGRDAAHVQAHAAQGAVLLDDGGFQAFVGCGKGSGIAAGAAAQYHHVVFGIGRTGKLRGLRCGRSGFGSFLGRGGRCGGFRRFGSSRRTGSFDDGNHAAFGNFVAHFHFHFFHHACGFGRNVHGGFVGFQCNQRVFHGNGIARFDFHGDDVHVFVAADVGYFQFD